MRYFKKNSPITERSQVSDSEETLEQAVIWVRKVINDMDIHTDDSSMAGKGLSAIGKQTAFTAGTLRGECRTTKGGVGGGFHSTALACIQDACFLSSRGKGGGLWEERYDS